MIDEKKLIEELEKQIVTITTPDDPEIRTKYWNAGISYAINCIEKQPKVGEWIPCSEGLPEEVEGAEYYDSVIVTLNDGRVAEGCYRNADKEWWVDAPDREHFS